MNNSASDESVGIIYDAWAFFLSLKALWSLQVLDGLDLGHTMALDQLDPLQVLVQDDLDLGHMVALDQARSTSGSGSGWLGFGTHYGSG